MAGETGTSTPAKHETVLSFDEDLAVGITLRECFAASGMGNLHRRRLSLVDAADYVAFDTEEFLRQNPETPDDNKPSEPFEPEFVGEAIERGDILEGLFDTAGELVATMWLTPHPEMKKLEVSNLVVRHDRRGEGIGAYFLNATHAIARTLHYPSCELHVDALNSGGVRLYLEHGYVIKDYEQGKEPGSLRNWLVAERLEEADYIPQPHDVVQVAAGDAKGLQQVIAAGYRGVRFKRGATPYTGVFTFVRSSLSR